MTHFGRAGIRTAAAGSNRGGRDRAAKAPRRSGARRAGPRLGPARARPRCTGRRRSRHPNYGPRDRIADGRPGDGLRQPRCPLHRLGRLACRAGFRKPDIRACLPGVANPSAPQPSVPLCCCGAVRRASRMLPSWSSTPRSFGRPPPCSDSCRPTPDAGPDPGQGRRRTIFPVCRGNGVGLGSRASWFPTVGHAETKGFMQ